MSSQDNDAIKQGNLLRDKGDFDGAIAAYTEAIGLDSQNVEAYCGRAYSYGKKGEFDRAITDYTEAVRLAPKYSGAYYNRGLAYSRKDCRDEAIADFTEVIRLDPEDAEAYYSRGVAYAVKGDHDKAIADFTEAIRLNPIWFQAFQGRANVYAEKGDKAKAKADFAQAKKLGYNANPDSSVFVQPALVSRWKYGKPPRTVTPAARRRLSFGWGSVIGGLLLPIFCLFLLFLLAVHSSGETVQNTFIGFFTVSMFGLLGFALMLNDRQLGKRIADLFENGIAHKSRIHKIGSMNIVVKTAPQWGGLVKVPKEDTLASLSPGDRVMLLVDPEDPKRRIILEQTTGAVYYDYESNSFDTRSKLPMLRFPAAVLFGTISVTWIVLLGRELLQLLS